ncbi:MAG: FHA domain-containing protein [Myxococcales bacterium]|nr:FHA domain-containing protein [Myxococcales bacterium]
MQQTVRTKADPGAAGWRIRDPVTRLRWWGDDRSFDLSESRRLLVGTASECDLRLEVGASASRIHASLEKTNEGWTIADLGSKNGTRQDGEDRASFLLAPGMEVELGRARLVAESAEVVTLREFLRRLIGWGKDTMGEVDRAFQAVRQMAHLRASLLVLGDGPIVGIARRIHRLVLGAERPFSAHARGEIGGAAVERARDGMVVFDAQHLPADFAHVLATSRLPDWRVRLVMGATKGRAAARVAAKIAALATVTVPSLTKRREELDQVLLAYAHDAVASFGAPGTGLRPQDLSWVRASGVKDHHEADEVMSRVVAVRNWGVSGGAARLGLTHGALSKYFLRRKIPT